MRTGSERSRGVRRVVRGGGAKSRFSGSARSGPKGPGRKTSAASSPRLEALIDELREIAEGVGVRVRQERLLREVGYHAQSGLVRLDGAEILLLDHDLSPEGRVDLLVGVLAARDLAGVEMSDEARRALALPEGFERKAAATSARDPGEPPAALPGDADPSSRND